MLGPAPSGLPTSCLFGPRLKSKILFFSLASLVPALGLFELWGYFHHARRAPTPEEWEGARPLVAEAYRASDVVVVAPHWAEPLARWKFGDDLMPLREVARPDVSRYPRAIEVSAMGERSPELRGWQLESEKRAGKISVRTLVNPEPPSVRFDFTDHLGPASAKVEYTKNGKVTSCPWKSRAAIDTRGYYSPPPFPPQRFQCEGEGPAHFVGVTVIQDDRALPRRCIFSPPPSQGGETVTRYEKVPLGDVIRGHLGIQWIMERDRLGSPITLRVVVDGDDIGTAVHEDGDGWKPFELPLGAHANAESATVEFRVTAKDDKDRHLCFEADTR